VELKDYMNLPAWCYFCRKETKTKQWDCVVCGFSKGHPKDWDQEKELDKGVNHEMVE